MLDRAEAERLVEAEKDAHLVDVAWHTATMPGTDIVLRKSVMFPVTVDPPPTVGHLLVEGTWKAEHQIEIFLYLVEGSQQTKLARLCFTHKHVDLHWHFYEQVKGPEIPEAVSHPPTTINEDTMLDEIFLSRLRIINVNRPFL